MSGLRPTIIKFGAFAFVMVLLTVSLFFIFGQYRTGSTTGYSALFADVSRLKTGQTVRVAGIRVGTVKGIKLRPDKKVLVTFDADRGVQAPGHRSVWRKITGNAAENRHHLRRDIAAQQRERLSERQWKLSKGKRRGLPRRFALHTIPEFAEVFETSTGLVARDDGCVDRADRGADHPVRFDTGLVERLIDTALISTERPAALKHQNDLARQSRRLFGRNIGVRFCIRHVARVPFCRHQHARYRSGR